MRYTEEQIDQAKSVDLYDFILNNPEFGDDFEIKGDSLRREDKNEKDEKVRIISVKRNSSFYNDWITMHGGDNIYFLTKLYGYTFSEAMEALLSDTLTAKAILPVNKSISEGTEKKAIKIPPRGFDSKRVYAYLTKQRKIPGDTVNMLMRSGLLYQDNMGNAVFISHNRDRVEVRGTNTYKGKYANTDYSVKDAFWYFGKSGDTVYITEGAIDAVSLYELLGRKKAIYASLPGVGNQCIIDRIVKAGKHRVVLAVDNDQAGTIRRVCNINLEHSIPPDPYKDWNEMLKAGAKLSDYGLDTMK